jgi:hypothetical protein
VSSEHVASIATTIDLLAGDLIVDVCRHAEPVCWSTRRG